MSGDRPATERVAEIVAEFKEDRDATDERVALENLARALVRAEAAQAQGAAPRAEGLPDRVRTDRDVAISAIEKHHRLRAALERLLSVAMTEEEDVSAATQDEWIAAIQQANEALAASSAPQALDVERLAAVFLGNGMWDAYAEMVDHGKIIAAEYARLSGHIETGETD